MMKNSKLRQGLLLVMAAIVLVIMIVFIITTGYDRNSAPKIGVIITGSINDDGWNGMHYQGVSYACEQLGAELLVKENVPEGTGRCAETVQELVAEGAEMIILSSYAYPEEVKDVVRQYPDIVFYGISAEHYAENMTKRQPSMLSGRIHGKIPKRKALQRIF